jgi:hypothetical protein
MLSSVFLAKVLSAPSSSFCCSALSGPFWALSLSMVSLAVPASSNVGTGRAAAGVCGGWLLLAVVGSQYCFKLCLHLRGTTFQSYALCICAGPQFIAL